MTTESLFQLYQARSPLRKRLLAYFFTNPEARLYLREIAVKIQVDPANLSRELARLEKEGVFASEKRGVQKYFYLNKEYPLYQELKSIIFKTIGAQGAIQRLLNKTPGIKRAFIYGSFAKNAERPGSDIDLCLIVDRKEFREESLLEGLHKLERNLEREVNYSFFTEAEWKSKQRSNDSFVSGLLRNRRIELRSEKD